METRSIPCLSAYVVLLLYPLNPVARMTQDRCVDFPLRIL